MGPLPGICLQSYRRWDSWLWDTRGLSTFKETLQNLQNTLLPIHSSHCSIARRRFDGGIADELGRFLEGVTGSTGTDDEDSSMLLENVVRRGVLKLRYLSVESRQLKWEREFNA